MTGFLYDNLNVYLFVGLFLLCCGIFGLVYRRTLIAMLISIELIMNGAGLNFVAFNRFVSPEGPEGMVFTLFIMGIAAAETAIALAVIILIFKRFKHIEGSEIEEMKE
ncbi:MAG: NADH-quinone oxidoreductase subunit K [Syntrophorhabdus sp. PtaU1.Bin002]|nr:MAG: NADH-quinone oxidoreductase subunit K [Syntrophorhabdus sp. PtaB.Bin006]OPY72443.1 MAG: NADH-quinone oxidoreductase subunit K [Syntrophorhabdus sp. PtaU1.Bin002]